ncbi:phosphatase PAP2 family protein [Vibrio fluvialis]|uniref:phosphatase PAP2 family protein n=1 Tax=Vibrio fluvialis TaxID=676 RepID=UPI000B31B783|nr:phosphatase PAP2 family protein [Vibrio fluvialis]MBY7997759.1 phosphatase PAP2 family protein [Vibrio fluvialis]MBY8105178.1 phosphatase PAP2 family protein [Vibrio fluvialis]
MLKRVIYTALVGATTLTAHAVHADNAITQPTDDGYVEAGDYIQLLVPASGYLAAWLNDDWEGAKQLTYSVATTAGIVQATKFTVGRIRPNAANNVSFPSGHTSAAFSGAAFLQSRYGSEWGIPGYIAATYVGGSRIYGNRHYADDVVAGAGIAFLVNQYFVSGYAPDGIAINAEPTGDGIMVNVSVSNDVLSYDKKSRAMTVDSGEQRNLFTLDIGFNHYDSLADIGANQTLSSTAPLDPHQPFATAKYTYLMENARSFELTFSPNETRRSGVVNQSFTVANTTYNAGESVFMAMRQWQLGGAYIRHFDLNTNVSLGAGVGLNWYLVEFETDLENGGRHSSITDYPILPSGLITAQYTFNEDWRLKARAEVQALSGNQVVLFESGINYQINRNWSVELKYSASRSKWDELETKYHTESAVISVTNQF